MFLNNRNLNADMHSNPAQLNKFGFNLKPTSKIRVQKQQQNQMFKDGKQ